MYSIRPSIVQTSNPHLLPNLKQASLRNIPPSLLSAEPCISSPSSTSSQMTPTGLLPDSLQKSTAASVCPGRCLTPPSRARNGKTCPGRRKDEIVAAFDANVLQVRARSCAEIPVVMEGSAESIETV